MNSSPTPKTRVISCNWPVRNDLSPAVREICHCVLPQRNDTRNNSNPCWVLDYEYHSSTYCRLERQKEWLLRPGRTVHLYPPGVVYCEKPRVEVELTHSAWFLFDGAMDSVLDRFVQTEGYAIFEDVDGIIGRVLHEAAMEAQKYGQDAYWSVQASLANTLACMDRATHVHRQCWQIPSQTVSNRDAPDLAAAVDDYLRAHLAERITLETLADHLGVSSSTLSHRYRELTGETPMAKLLRQRVEAAKILVRRGYPLRHIASHVGFCDEYHFAKTFKRLTGMTPKQYRRTDGL